MLYTTDAHFYNSSLKIGSIYFFSSSDMYQSHHPLGCHATGINSSLIFFSSSLHFSNLICQVKSLIRIIVSGSTPSKLLSRLILLKSILRIPISLQENTTLPESKNLKLNIFSFAYKTVKSF